jgi:hypothetical protein
MFIPNPGSWFLSIPDPRSRIPDPKTATKERGEKKIVVQPFFVATNITKFKIILFLNWRRKNLGQFTKNDRIFYPQNCQLALKNIGLESGIRKKTIPDPGSRGQKGIGSRIRIRNTGLVMDCLTLFVGKMLPASNAVATNFFDFTLINLHSKRITLSHVSVHKKSQQGIRNSRSWIPTKNLKFTRS